MTQIISGANIGNIYRVALAAGGAAFHLLLTMLFMLIALFFIYRDGESFLSQVDSIGERILPMRWERISRIVPATISSTVTGMLANLRRDAVDTYTIGFSAAEYNEVEYARIAARHFGATAHEYFVTERDVCCGVAADDRRASEVRVNEIMRPSSACCGADEPIEEARRKLHEHRATSLPVVDGAGSCCGTVSVHGLDVP